MRKMLGVVSKRRKTPLLPQPTDVVVSKNVVGATPHGRIGGASRPVEGKKRPFPVLLRMVDDWESPCSARDEFGLRDSSARSQRGVASDDARSER